MPTRFALLSILAVAGIGVSVPLAQQSDRTRNPLANTAGASAAGRRLYDQTCVSCHGPAGQGDRGPALDTGRFARGNEDADLFHTIRTGVPGTQMPPFAALTDEQTWQLVAYIRSLSAPASKPADSATTGGNPAAGEALFFAKAGCAGCHQVNGRGGIVGPDLSSAGRAPVATLRAKILDPSAPAMTARGTSPAPELLVARTKDGREIRGVRRSEDTFSVAIADATGTVHVLEKLTLAAFRVENRSLMPGNYGTLLTPAEL